MARKPKVDPAAQLDLFGGGQRAEGRGQSHDAARPERRPEAEVEGPVPAHSPPPTSGSTLSPQPSALAEALRLETNLAAFAGAGSGKTYGLVTCALHVLSGARKLRGPVEPAGLCMLTFTEKAAGEMRERLLERLEALAAGKREEQDLEASFEALGRPFPPPAFFKKLRDELGAAYIGTFHALCIQLLKQAPPGLAGTPGFTLLDERSAKALFEDLAVRLVLEKIQAGEPLIVELAKERSFAGVVATLLKHWRTAREEGAALELLEVGDPSRARREFEARVQEVLVKLDECLIEVRSHPRPELRDRWLESAARARAALVGLKLDDYPACHEELMAAWELSKARTPLKPFWDLIRSEDKRLGLDAWYGAMRIAPHEAAFRALLAELGRRVDARLEELNALDFTALLLRARSLLRDHPEARREAQARFGALLVDEFQDTNGVQLDLVHLLAEERGEAPRPLTAGGSSDEVRALPIEAGFLCIVGDRKQGIYEFRGADVSLMEEAAQRLEKVAFAPGRRAFLTTSRRSSPALVRFCNAVSADLLGPPDPVAPGFEVRFHPEHDALVPHRGEGPLEKPVLSLAKTFGEAPDAEALRRADARAVAQAVSSLLADPSPRVVDKSTGRLRRVEPGDVAILFTRFTAVQTWEQSLVLQRVPHRVVRGRGFFGAQEIVDLAGLLALLANPGDDLSLAAVLRSPLVALSDPGLLLLAEQLGGRLDGARLLDVTTQVELPGDDGAKLETFRALYARLRHARHRLKVAELLAAVFAETGFEERIAAAPHGEQALGNLEKLLTLARAADARGAGGCAALARELLDLAETEPTEAQGEVVEQGDAVTLCTIHQAKGLEWPVVVLADLPASPVNFSGWAELDRRGGLALQPFPEGELAKPKSLRFERLRDTAKKREAAERRRLLYVALTRARDLLVLGLRKGAKSKLAANTAAALLEGPLSGFGAAALMQEVDVDQLPRPRPMAPAAPPPDARARLDAAVARATTPAPLAPVALLPVTQLQDFAACPRRYHYAHQVGLLETPANVDWSESDEAAAPDPRAQGVAAHRLLERTPLELVGKKGLPGALAALAAEEGLDAPEPLLACVLAFWETPFGKTVAAADPAQVFRELPFALHLGKKGGQRLVLRGQIDLLFLDPQGTAWVLDYKTVHRAPAGLEPYTFQLTAYALAARKLAPTARRVQTGVAFLRDQPVGLLWEEPRELALESLEQQLCGETRALLAAQRDGAWEGRGVERCRALECGFLARCHPEAARG